MVSTGRRQQAIVIMGRCTLRSFFTPETLKTAGLLMAPLVVGSLAALGVFLKMDADFSTYFSALRRRTKSYQDKVRKEASLTDDFDDREGDDSDIS